MPVWTSICGMRATGGEEGTELRRVVLGLAVMLVGALLWGSAGSAVGWGQENPLEQCADAAASAAAEDA